MKSFVEIEKCIRSLPHPFDETIDGIYQRNITYAQNLNKYIGYPIDNVKCIHVAGTNGKGSCVQYLSVFLSNLGYKVGTYQSPHFNSFRERIKVDGQLIPEDYIVKFWTSIKGYITGDSEIRREYPNWRMPSYSEFFILMAYSYFKESMVDFAIIEVGVGGQNDPTNIIKTPLVSIITSLGLNHKDLLGETMNDITRNKCGIIKVGCPVIVGTVEHYCQEIINDEGEKKGCIVLSAHEWCQNNKIVVADLVDINDSQMAEFHTYNLEIALCTINFLEQEYNLLSSKCLYFDAYDIVSKLIQTGKLLGRWDIVNKSPLIISDIGSNELALKTNLVKLENLMKTNQFKKLVFILSFCSDEVLSILQFLPLSASYIFPVYPGMLNPHDFVNGLSIHYKIADSIDDAFQIYMLNKDDKDILYIGGNIYIMSDVYSLIDKYFKK